MKPFNLIKDIIEKRGAIEEVYWVACGGSLIDLLHHRAEALGRAQPRGRVQP